MEIFLVILMYAGWSSIFSLGKWVLGFSSPLFLTAFRMLLAGVLLSGYVFFRKRGSIKLTKKQFFSYLVLGFVSMYLTNILEFWGLQHLSAAKTCFIYSLSPFFAAFFSYLHFGETMTRKKWLGMLIGFLGFLPVLSMQTGSEDLLSHFGWLSLAEIAIIGASLFSVYGWVLLRLLVKEENTSPMQANGFSMLFGGLFSLLHSLFVDVWDPTPVASGYEGSFLQGLLVMTLISNIVCYNLYGFLLRKYSATFLSFMGLLSPVFASLISWALLGETPSPLIFASTGVISLGLWIMYKEELAQGYITKTKVPQTSS
ncbi:MAG: DMT family transporter [Chlamydiota bacterium]